ncbi:MAG: apolipoprotein N-acyltransferase [Gemmatimonadota bacterium]|nr:MAG: apolipoprotein N-acyltransferase [Gemmatimonadota bacterium]
MFNDSNYDSFDLFDVPYLGGPQQAMDRRFFLLSLSSGFLLALSFPPLKLGYLAWVGLVPLLFLIDQEIPTTTALKYGYLTGFFFNLGTIYWIAWDTEPGLLIIVSATLAVVLILSLYFVVFTFFFRILRKKFGNYALLSVPFLWTAIEYLRSLGVLAFPWTSLAYSQSYYLSFIQMSSITSAYGVSFWVVTLNVTFYILIKKGLKWKASFVILMVLTVILALSYWYGRSILSRELPDADLQVAAVQGNIDPKVKWDERYRQHNFNVYIQMTKENFETKTELVVWPETAIPFHLAYEKEFRDVIQKLTDTLNVPILTGVPHYTFDPNRDYVFHNSAFLFNPNQAGFQEYAKMHLVPFSEHTPFVEFLPFLREMHFGQSDFTPGIEYTLFQLPQGKFAVLICFESIFPELVREFVNQGAQFLVNITNDAWFGKTSSPYQHARIAVFRAVENRIGIARCANTGVSMFVDPYGRVSEETEIFTEQMVTGGVVFKKEETFYTKYGNIFSEVCVVVSVGWLLLSIFIKKRSSQKVFV